MSRFSIIALGLALAVAAPASAANLAFSGTFSNTNPPAAMGGRCPVLTVNIANTPPFANAGTSNFGAFTANQSHCLDGGPPIATGAADQPYYDGLFSYVFAGGDTLTGTYGGVLSNAGTMGVIDNVQHFLITGGTGQFAGAEGGFLGTGQLRFVPGSPPLATLTISDGIIRTGAVPEPASWALLIAGFGAIGASLRRQRRDQAAKPDRNAATLVPNAATA